MIDNSCIAFLDSGIGGLPYLEQARELLPNENFAYIADSENFPYGEKDSESLKKIIYKTVAEIIHKLSPKMIVLACNTASVVALSDLREEFKIPFIGVVPAVKPAAEHSKLKRIGLLATNRTVHDNYTNWLIENFASDCKVFKYPAGDIVNFVENSYIDSNKNNKLQIISSAIKKFNEDKIDALVLGCTHFIYLENEIKSLLDNNVNVIDSRIGVSNQIKRILEKENMLSNNNTEIKFYNTGLENERFKKFSELFKLEYSGSLNNNGR